MRDPSTEQSDRGSKPSERNARIRFLSSLPRYGAAVLLTQIVGFILLILWCWADEVLDLPARLFGAAPSGTNLIEAAEESFVIVLLGSGVVYTSYRLLARIRKLEGVIPTCSFCKKVRVENDWRAIEEYFSENSEMSFTHSFCPECMEKHYGIKD